MNTPKDHAEALKAFKRLKNKLFTYVPCPPSDLEDVKLIEAALSAQAGWRPISEASKHEHILAFGRDGVHIAKWSSMGNKWRGVNLSHSIPQPTHFMPLPSPPAEGK